MRPGQAATIEVSAFPGKVFKGKVAFLYPTITPETRTGKVRIELANPGGMLIYLDHAWQAIQVRRAAEGKRPNAADLYAAVMEGAVERVRPKMMTVVAIMAGLLPIMWTTGAGSEVMRRIAAPMVGGMISSVVLTLIVIPALYAIVKEYALMHERPGSADLRVLEQADGA